MRIVLDEALPRKLAALLENAACRAEPFPVAWKGMTDGALIDALDEGNGAILVTCDRNMPFQQTLGSRRVAVLVLPGQRIGVLSPLVPAIVETIASMTIGTVRTLDGAGFAMPPGRWPERSD